MEYILGAIVSLIVEGTKKFVKTDSFTTHAILFSASVVGAGVYVTLSNSDFWPSAVQILVSAAAFHNLIIRKFYN